MGANGFYCFLHSNSLWEKLLKMTIVHCAMGKLENHQVLSFQSGFRDLQNDRIWCCIFFQTEQTLSRKKSGFRAAQYTLSPSIKAKWFITKFYLKSQGATRNIKEPQGASTLNRSPFKKDIISCLKLRLLDKWGKRLKISWIFSYCQLNLLTRRRFFTLIISPLAIPIGNVH